MNTRARVSLAGLKDLLGASPRLTLAAAESLTSGRVQAKIGAISGASEFFLGGITAYTIAQKVRHLGVGRRPAIAANGVSERVVREMAGGVCSLFGSDLGVATTGYAEPAPGQGIAAPMAWWAVCHRGSAGPGIVRVGRIELRGLRRVQVQEAVADAVLADLVEYLQGLRG